MSSARKLVREVPYRSCALDEKRIEGQLALADLPRLRGAVGGDASAPIEVSIAFAEDAQRRVVYTGRVATRLVLFCQRCLQPTEKALAFDIAGIVVASDEEAAAVPRDWEPVLAADDRLDLHELIEDELLLALPMTVQCERPACRAAHENDETEQETPVQAPTNDKPNPFARLAALKHGRGPEDDHSDDDSR